MFSMYEMIYFKNNQNITDSGTWFIKIALGWYNALSDTLCTKYFCKKEMNLTLIEYVIQ